MTQRRFVGQVGLLILLIGLLAGCVTPATVDTPNDATVTGTEAVAPKQSGEESQEQSHQEGIAMSDESSGLPTDLAGRWDGHIEYGGASLLTVFNITRNDAGNYAATVDSPDQNAYGIPVQSVGVEGDAVRIDIAAAGAVYEGTLDETGTKMTGNWKQGGVEIALAMQRSEGRPQDPRPPFPYVVVDVTFPNHSAGIELAGTITRPAGDGPFPGIVLITGSGPQNRDEEVFDHRPFLVLADALTRAGLAVLRFDDRGVAESEGNLAIATMVDFAGDAASALAFLADQPYVDSTNVGFLGHSEGGVVGPMVAADDPTVAFLILLAGTSVPGHEVLIEQSRAFLKASGASNEIITLSADINSRTYHAVMDGGDTPETRDAVASILKEIGMQQAQIDAQLPILFSPWYQHFLSYDPQVALQRISCPVLGLFGTLDLQVLVGQNLPPLESALATAPTDVYSVMAIEGKNHFFQSAVTGLIDEYAKIDETISPEVLEIIVDWLRSEIM